MGKKKKTEEYDNKKEIKKYKMVTSSECEKCKNRCVEGQKYLDRFTKGRIYKGVVCKK